MVVRNEYSVCQFFEDGQNEYVRRYVSAEEAIVTAKHYCYSVGAQIGIVKRVIVTDGGDNTVFLWEYKKGVVFPTQEMLKGK